MTISSGTHKRTPWRPLGDESVAMVKEGNGLASRFFDLFMHLSFFEALVICFPISSNFKD